MTRVLTTHAGSLPRPPELDEAWARRSRGEAVDAGRLAELVAAATEAVVARQAAVGLDIASDGEQGRESFFTHVRDRFSGFGGEGESRTFHDMRAAPEYLRQRLPRFSDPGSVSLARLPAATAEIDYLGRAAIDEEIALLKQVASAHSFAELFVTVPSPGIIATAMTNRHYATIEEYVDAVAAGLAEEYRAVVESGCLLQIDAPDLAMERHVLFGERPVEDFLAFASHVVRAINRAVDGLPAERIRLHVCWGNYDGPHLLDVPLAETLPVYSEAAVGAVVLSLLNSRHAHEYRLLDRLPQAMGVIVGCIDTTSNYVEHPEVVADRIVRAAEVVGNPARVQAGTDCGFATAAGLRDVAPDVAWLKLASLVDGARRASERLS